MPRVAYWDISGTSYPASIVVFPAPTAAVRSKGVFPDEAASSVMAVRNSYNAMTIILV